MEQRLILSRTHPINVRGALRFVTLDSYCGAVEISLMLAVPLSLAITGVLVRFQRSCDNLFRNPEVSESRSGGKAIGWMLLVHHSGHRDRLRANYGGMLPSFKTNQRTNDLATPAQAGSKPARHPSCPKHIFFYASDPVPAVRNLRC
uniref:Uncharacterized protein n=1 Tax=Anopheles farauti TaxID=69004 RepID=A0A182Q4U3_9DIPT